MNTYIFYIGKDVEQDDFVDDADAMSYAKRLENEYGKPVKVARWLDNGESYSKKKDQAVDKKLIGMINDMLNIQQDNVHDAYSAGMFNGIEAVAAVIEQREPKFVDCPKVPMGERLLGILNQAREEKPTGPGDQARYHAIFITELEKIYGYYSTWIVGKSELSILPALLEHEKQFIVTRNDIIKAFGLPERAFRPIEDPRTKPKVGSLVHYISIEGKEFPAIVRHPWDYIPHPDCKGKCNLQVFAISFDGNNDMITEAWFSQGKAPVTFVTGAPYSFEHKPNTWHWPEF